MIKKLLTYPGLNLHLRTANDETAVQIASQKGFNDALALITAEERSRLDRPG